MTNIKNNNHYKSSHSAPHRYRTHLFLTAICLLLALPLISSCKKKPEAGTVAGLCSAASRGDNMLVRTLLQSGTSVNSRDENGCTAVTRAAAGGHLSTVQLLMENGADINTPCNSGVNPLFVAVDRDHADIVRLLLPNCADVNRTDPAGGSALTYAVSRGNPVVVRAMLDKGAEVNLRLRYGETPLILAVQRVNEPVVRMLLDKGADVRAKGANEMSPLHFAIEKGHTEITRLLIEKGADVNQRASDGFTPISRARSGKLDQIVALLQAAGAREPEDSFRAAAAEQREKQDKARREMESRGVEFVVTDADVQYYVKPSSIQKTGSSCRVKVWEYRFAIGEVEEIGMELNCSERTYRHLSNVLVDPTGKVLQMVPVDSYVLADNGNIRGGTAMHRIMSRVCQ